MLKEITFVVKLLNYLTKGVKHVQSTQNKTDVGLSIPL